MSSDIRDGRGSLAAPVQTATSERLMNLYLDLLEQTLTGAILEDVGLVPSFDPNPVPADRYEENVRLIGMDWPSRAVTMVGLKRLRNLRQCAADVLKDNVPGDFIETGVWRGGASIYLRALLAAHGVTDRCVWVADSFAGLPPPNPVDYPADKNDELYKVPVLSVSLDEVKKNFAKFNMLDSQVQFLPGWFKDTLLHAPIEKLAILRLDGDLYESTIQALTALYHKVSTGGFVIIDDFGLAACRQAVQDFRAERQISDELNPVDGMAVFWRKTSGS